VGAPIVFERRSHIDGNIMGENKDRKQNFPLLSPTPKVKKTNPPYYMLNFIIGYMKFLFLKTIDYHVKLGLIPLPKNVGAF
jgi:hypothetical protein